MAALGRGVLPRSHDRGPIEACSATMIPRTRAHFRGHMTAAPLKRQHRPRLFVQESLTSAVT